MADIDWYERSSELRPGMIFDTAEGLVRLDRGVPGDGTKWYVDSWYGDHWSCDDGQATCGGCRALNPPS